MFQICRTAESYRGIMALEALIDVAATDHRNENRREPVPIPSSIGQDPAIADKMHEHSGELGVVQEWVGVMPRLQGTFEVL